MPRNRTIVRTSLLAIAFACLLTAHPQAPSQQTATPALPPEAYGAVRYNRSDEIKVTGQIEQVETVDGKLFVWVTAKSVVKEGYGARPGTEAQGKGLLWRVDGVAEKVKKGDRDKLVRGAGIEVSGNNSADTSCEPTCRINARRLSFD